MDKTATGWGKKSAGAPGWKRSSGRKIRKKEVKPAWLGALYPGKNI